MPTLQLDIKAQTEELLALKGAIEALQQAVASLDRTAVGSGKQAKAMDDTGKAAEGAAGSTEKVVKAAEKLDKILSKTDPTLQSTAKQLSKVQEIAKKHSVELEQVGRGYKAYLTELESLEAKTAESLRTSLKDKMKVLRAATREGNEEAKASLLTAQGELKKLEDKILGFKNIAALRGSVASLYKAGILDAAGAAKAGVTAYYDTLERESLRRQREAESKINSKRMQETSLAGRKAENEEFLRLKAQEEALDELRWEAQGRRLAREQKQREKLDEMQWKAQSARLKQEQDQREKLDKLRWDAQNARLKQEQDQREALDKYLWDQKQVQLAKEQKQREALDEMQWKAQNARLQREQSQREALDKLLWDEQGRRLARERRQQEQLDEMRWQEQSRRMLAEQAQAEKLDEMRWLAEGKLHQAIQAQREKMDEDDWIARNKLWKAERGQMEYIALQKMKQENERFKLEQKRMVELDTMKREAENKEFLRQQRYDRLTIKRKIVYDYQNNGGTVAGLAEKYGEAETIRALAPYVKELEPQLLKLKSSTRDVAKAQHELKDSLWEVHSAARGVTGSLGLLWLTYGSLLPLVGGFALASALKTAVTAGTEFNYQMKFVQVLGEEADSTMKGLSDTLLRMGGEGMFKPIELAEGMRILAQAGFQANDALKALPTTTKLAVIGETDVATAAEMAAGTMYAFGLGMRDLGHIGDVVAKAAAMSQTNVNKMGESFKYAGSTAKQYNVTLEEMAGILTVLANSNITGSSAGTAAKNMVKDLYGTTGKSRKFMDSIGLSPYDEQGNRKSFLQTLDEIGKRLEQMGDKARDIAINEIFDERAAKAYIKLFDSGELLKFTKAMQEASYNSGFLNRSYQALAETTKGELKQALGALQGSLIEVFKGSEGNLQSLLKSFKSAVQSNEFKGFLKDVMSLLSGSVKFLVEYGSQAATLLKILVAYKAASVAGNVVGGLAVNFKRATKMATSLTGAVQYGTIALRTLGLTTLAAGGPIAWLIAGVAGLATAFMAFSYSSKEHTSSAVRDLQGLSSTMTVVSESQQKQLLKEVEAWDLRRAKLEEAKAGTAAMAELERQRSAALSESFAGQVRLYDEEKSRINEAYRVAEEAYRRKKISVAEFSDIKAKLEKRDLINESEYLSLSIQQYQKHLRAMAKAREKESESRKGFWSDFYTIGSHYLDKLIEKVNKFSEAMSLAYKLRNGLWFKSVESTGASLPKVPSLGEMAQKIRDQEKLDETRLGGRQLLAKGQQLRDGQGGFGADIDGSTQWAAQANEVATALNKTGSKIDLAMSRYLAILSGEAHNQIAKAKSGGFNDADKPTNLGGTESLNLPKQGKFGSGGKDFASNGLLAAENKRYQDEVARVRGAAQNTRAELEAQYRNRLIDETAYLTQADDLRRKAQLDERTKLVEHMQKLEAIAKGTKDKGLKARAAADAAHARSDLARFDEKAASENTQAVYDAFGRTGKPIAEGLASGAQKLTDLQQEIDLLREGTAVRRDATVVARELAATKHEETLENMAAAALTPELKKTLEAERQRLQTYKDQTKEIEKRINLKPQTAFDASLQQAKEDRAFERKIRHYSAAEKAVARYRRELERKARAEGIENTSGIEQDVLDYSKDQSSEQGIEGVMNGARDAWTEFQDRAANTAAFTKQAFTSAFDGASDSLANFLSRGKWTWKAFGEAFQDFAKQMLAQLLKIIIMRAIAGLAGGGGGSANSFGKGAAMDVAGGSLGTDALSEQSTMLARQQLHTGGIVGGEGSLRSPVAISSNSTRYHTGGIAADEYPAILQRGEGVFTKGQMAAMGLLANKGGGAQSVVINVTVNSETGKTEAQGNQEDGKALGRLIGNKVREVIVEEKRNGGLLA